MGFGVKTRGFETIEDGVKLCDVLLEVSDLLGRCAECAGYAGSWYCNVFLRCVQAEETPEGIVCHVRRFR